MISDIIVGVVAGTLTCLVIEALDKFKEYIVKKWFRKD